MIEGEWGVGGGGVHWTGNLWDLQFNLLRHFPVGRAADCELRGVYVLA